jgi:7,8-dihydro-6-hydroxymethylpterin dimethyltransferase
MLDDGIAPRNGDRCCMTPRDILVARPATRPADHSMSLTEARQRMVATDQWSASQFMGRRWPIGCVALEITQRCNLDCTACYLSEHSEAVKDLPLEELFRRIEMIFDHYGPYTDVQVTGGDPTLRKRDELVAIVRRIREKGMRPTLLTNGIRARRGLLQELVAVGLVDVAFHVDMTQQRSGYGDEIALNALRQEYIERTRCLGLPVMFNTTVTNDNFEQIPEIVAFFVRNSDAVRLASFQLQADTGRGVLGRRDARITIGSVRRQIELGANTPLSFDTAQIGHARCNRYAMTLVINGKVYDVLDDEALFNDVLERTGQRPFDRQSRSAAFRTLLKGVLTSPRLALRGAVWLSRKMWRARTDLARARGRVDKLSFFIHDFMDACQLEKERIDACVFAAATNGGPISMCLHNAKRDVFILLPVEMNTGESASFWNPLSGETTPAPIILHGPIALRHKVARGPLKGALATTGTGRRPGRE